MKIKNSKGYYGNGYDCHRTEEPQTTPRTPPPVVPCRDCSENAQCSEGYLMNLKLINIH